MHDDLTQIKNTIVAMVTSPNTTAVRAASAHRPRLAGSTNSGIRGSQGPSTKIRKSIQKEADEPPSSSCSWLVTPWRWM